MSASISHVLFWALACMTVAGAVMTVASREVMRMAIGLGVFLLGVAGSFAYYGFGFLALAEVFVYVGGVLVLMLFAIMLLRRTGTGVPDVGVRSSLITASICVSVTVLLFAMLLPLAALFSAGGEPGGVSALASALLGDMLPQFELIGVLLLAALVAVVAIVGGERR